MGSNSWGFARAGINTNTRFQQFVTAPLWRETDNIISHRGKYGQQRNVTSNYEWSTKWLHQETCAALSGMKLSGMLCFCTQVTNQGKWLTMTHSLACSQKCNSVSQFPSLCSIHPEWVSIKSGFKGSIRFFTQCKLPALVHVVFHIGGKSPSSI